MPRERASTERGGPIFAEEGGEGESMSRVGIIVDGPAPPRGLRRRRGTRAEPQQAVAAGPVVGRRDLAEQAEVALAAAAGVGPLLLGPAGRAADGVRVGSARGGVILTRLPGRT